MDGPSRNKAIREQAAGFVDDLSTWKDSRGYVLSDRVWKNKHVVRQQIASTLRESLATGRTTAQTTKALRGYIDPAYGGNAYSGAERLAVTETSRANALATRQAASVTPGVRWLRYEVSGAHPRADECDGYAERNEGHGRGVYPIDDCPMPPRHPRCACVVSMVFDQSDMVNLAERLRVEYGLDQEPTNLSPADLVEWRRQTKELKEQVVFLFRGWTQQTGLVTLDDLAVSTRTVKEWVSLVKQGKQARRAARVVERAATRDVAATERAAIKDVTTRLDRAAFADDEAATAWRKETFPNWEKHYTEDELDAITDYRSSGYRPINTMLRQGEDAVRARLRSEIEVPDSLQVPFGVNARTAERFEKQLAPKREAWLKQQYAEIEDRIAEIHEHIKLIDRSFTLTKAPHDLEAWRAINVEQYGDITRLRGTIITDDGYTSTTIQHGVRDHFVEVNEGRGHDPAVIRVLIPKDASLVPIDAALPGVENAGWEEEILLPRGSRFRVIDVITERDGPPMLTVELMP